MRVSLNHEAVCIQLAGASDLVEHDSSAAGSNRHALIAELRGGRAAGRVAVQQLHHRAVNRSHARPGLG